MPRGCCTLKEKRILWVDDEIDLLRSHIIFLEEKGYEVIGVSSGEEAIAALGERRFDLLLLDETMPGRSGLETLQGIKEIDANLPVIMITKNEAEDLMDQAIGMKIDDYLLKPINPLQIYSAAKRLLDAHRIQEGAVSKDYLQTYRRIDGEISPAMNWKDWATSFVPIQTPKSYWPPTSSGARPAWNVSEACSPLPSTTADFKLGTRGIFSWPEIVSVSSPSTTLKWVTSFSLLRS